MTDRPQSFGPPEPPDAPPTPANPPANDQPPLASGDPRLISAVDSAVDSVVDIDPNTPQLVEFLRLHRPAPPPAHPAMEQHLWLQIQQLERDRRRNQHRLWMGAIGAITLGCAALLTWGRNPSNLAPAIADADLENFLEDTWVMTVAPDTLSTNTASTDDTLPWSFDPTTWEPQPSRSIVAKNWTAMVIAPARPYL
ncbi:MAG: hypothetical protein EA001_15405 [Oscillatoriales cyanobacterium]|nr:MAG: hypothetical protein EA001_15405 [Oscillatoriales cyanobacterium]